MKVNPDYEIFYSMMLYTISAFVSIAVNFYFALRSRKSIFLTAYMNLQIMLVIWLLANVLRKSAPNEEVAWLWIVTQYLAVCMFGIIFFDFSYIYRFGKRVIYPFRLFAYSLSGFNYIMLFTNPVHHWFYRSFDALGSVKGPYFYFHTLWSYTLLFFAFLLLQSAIIRNAKSAGIGKSLAVSMGILTPLFVNVIYVFGKDVFSFDLTPIAFNISTLTLGFSAYRGSFLDINKVSQAQIFDNIHEGIFIIDANDRIIYRNPVITNNIDNYSKVSKFTDLLVFGQHIENQIMERELLFERVRACTENSHRKFETELKVMVPDGLKTYLFKMERLDDAAGDRIGYLIRMVDITQQRSLVTSVEEKNEALGRINHQLSKNISATKQLAIAKERSRISKEIHDILGHTMTMVISLLSMADVMVSENKSEAHSKVKQSMEIIRGGLVDLKKSLRKTNSGDIEANVLNEELGNLIEEYEQSGIKVDYVYKKAAVQLSSEVFDTIYRICQEGLTNALKHGKAKNVTVGLRYVEQYVDLFIIDDGKGCPEIVKGNGISGMENRVNELAGYFSCGSPDGDGFNIHVTLPLETV